MKLSAWLEDFCEKAIDFLNDEPNFSLWMFKKWTKYLTIYFQPFSSRSTDEKNKI